MEAVVFLVFILVFILLFFGLFSVAEGRPGSLKTPDVRMRKRGSGRVKASQAASIAMRRAGYDVGEQYVQVTDIGLLTYRHTDEPKLVRYGDVVIDTHYLRPFAELWLPHAAHGAVRFEIADGDGRLRYADEANYNLVRGKNTLLPRTWLPLQGKQIEPEDWTLSVLASGSLLGKHVFGWQAVGGGRLHPYIDEDGEMSPELQEAMSGSARRGVSLNELLADQEDW